MLDARSCPSPSRTLCCPFVRLCDAASPAGATVVGCVHRKEIARAYGDAIRWLVKRGQGDRPARATVGRSLRSATDVTAPIGRRNHDAPIGVAPQERLPPWSPRRRTPGFGSACPLTFFEICFLPSHLGGGDEVIPGWVGAGRVGLGSWAGSAEPSGLRASAG
jgi:hypothetical protein